MGGKAISEELVQIRADLHICNKDFLADIFFIKFDNQAEQRKQRVLCGVSFTTCIRPTECSCLPIFSQIYIALFSISSQRYSFCHIGTK